ncbi:HigA family addiction module antitoxin [Gephyromycinifex aptenodytis]|uniref:HigA family addiction module antitoxin n=1 Tax=Gephyromycinifex aptenodytis TaxID=2716227 RepID=UPI001444B28D|nr:HigA family addiction module antitoxin [Gephyromycinifex aptenodytis]
MTNTQLVEPVPPGDVLAEELEAREWSQADFADIIDRPAQLVSAIVAGKKSITPETATQIAAALGTSAQMWLNLQDSYDLALMARDPAARGKLDEVRLRSEMNDLAPVALLRKRGHLPAGTLSEQADALCRLLHIESLDGTPPFDAAARRGNTEEPPTPTQRAWFACARAGASARPVDPFDRDGLRHLGESLTTAVQTPENFAALPELLARVGVRLVYVEAFPGSKISGVSFLLDDDPGQPCIALSGLGKRFDKVLFTLLHEIAHIVLGHVEPGAIIVDEGEDESNDVEDAANELAGAWCLPLVMNPPSQPRRNWVQAEAQRQGVHPLVVIGRLQHEGIVDWKSELVRGAPRVDTYLAQW